MRTNNAYTVEYRLFQNGETKKCDVLAYSKENAYIKAIDKIVKDEGEEPYSLWVSSVTYQNGNVRVFNTFEGKSV